MSDLVRRLRSGNDDWYREAADRIEQLEAGLADIDAWAQAYPLVMFPKPDLERARRLLEAGGMTLDAISADAMRHVVIGVGEIARRTLESKE